MTAGRPDDVDPGLWERTGELLEGLDALADARRAAKRVAQDAAGLDPRLDALLDAADHVGRLVDGW